MSEQNMRGKIIEVLKPLDAVSVENPVCPGTPDVNFADGMCELKWIRRWPVKPETPVLIEHFTPQQRIWLMRRWNAGGNVWLLLSCQKSWLLFDGLTAQQKVGRVTRGELESCAHKVWTGGLEAGELVDIFRRGRRQLDKRQK
jgi:hypothetical protein